jgi:hypothetical protein
MPSRLCGWHFAGGRQARDQKFALVCDPSLVNRHGFAARPNLLRWTNTRPTFYFLILTCMSMYKYNEERN